MTTFRHSSLALAALLVASSLSTTGATFSAEWSRFNNGGTTLPADVPGEKKAPEAEVPETKGPLLSPWLVGLEEGVEQAPENKAPEEEEGEEGAVEVPEAEDEVQVPGTQTRVSAFTIPGHLVPPIGEGYLLSKSHVFSSREGSISEIAASESLKVFVWSKSMEPTAGMKKNAYKVKFASGEQYQGEFENLENGYFAISLDFDGESGPMGEATLSFELEDQGKNKFKESVVFTRVDAASHDGASGGNKAAEDETVDVLIDENSCVPCSNEPSAAMASNNRTCEEWRLTETKCAVPTYAWRKDKVCKLSCFLSGHAYDDDKCC